MKKFKNMNTISFNTGLVLILSIIVCFLYELLFNKKLEGFYTTNTNTASTNPATTNPASTNPTSTNPASTNPATTNPASTNPVSTNPASTNPALTNPASTNPSSTNPATTNPTSTNPTTTKKIVNYSGCKAECSAALGDTTSNTVPETKDDAEDILLKKIIEGKEEGPTDSGAYILYTAYPRCDTKWMENKLWGNSRRKYMQHHDGLMPCQIDNDCYACPEDNRRSYKLTKRQMNKINQFRKERKDETERDMITDGGSNEYAEYDPYRVTYDAYNFAQPGKLSFAPGSLSGTLAGRELNEEQEKALQYQLGKHLIEVHNQNKNKQRLIIQKDTKGDTNIFAPHINIKRKPNNYDTDYHNPRAEFR